jgi:hypothetical protein
MVENRSLSESISTIPKTFQQHSHSTVHPNHVSLSSQASAERHMACDTATERLLLILSF